MTRLRLPIVTLCFASAIATGCITTTDRKDVYQKGRIEVFLRQEKKAFSVVEKNFEHPATIAPVRMAYILSRLDLRVGDPKDDERQAGIPTEILFDVADGVSQALAEADPNQEVTVMAIRRLKRWGVFDKNHLTSFIAYMRDDQLWIHLSRSDWEIPPRQEDKPPQPQLSDSPMAFRIYSGTAIIVVNPNTVSIDWRDPIFSRPTRTKVLPSGEVMRRTILMESAPEDLEEPAVGLPNDLSPDQLRELADLEERRRSGAITEAEYMAGRRDVLQRQ